MRYQQCSQSLQPMHTCTRTTTAHTTTSITACTSSQLQRPLFRPNSGFRSCWGYWSLCSSKSSTIVSSAGHWPWWGGGPRTGPPDMPAYASYTSIPNSHNGDTSRKTSEGQLVAFGTSPQGFWAGAREKEGLESPGCEVNHSKAYRPLSVSDCPRPSERRTPSKLVSGLATSPPSREKACAWTGEGATPVPSVVPNELGGQSTLSQQFRAPVRQSSLAGGPAGGRRSAPGIERALRKTRCLQNTSVNHPSPRGLSCPGGLKQ